MSSLPTQLRNLLERTIINARDEAEKAARAALIRLAVHQHEAYNSLSQDDRGLRNRLRAEARRLGESVESQGRDKAEPSVALVAEVAYAQWHRMLFARFLAENGLLMHPQGVAITLVECAELAADEGEPDAWMLASRYAARMLPGIFRNNDPTLQVRFDAAGRLVLEKLLDDLPAMIFTADDSLGWAYQFWQTKRKKEVNESGVRIAGADIGPVTQLFTEHYMVQFLLHNSLGAWWASRHLGHALPTDLDYLRLCEDGSPTAGGFPNWPKCAADLRVIDPCCGSGHFLVAAFALLRRIRMSEEGLGEAQAGDAVIRDNLYGLELDPRCTQIAVFALALAAWKAGGYRILPEINIACSGLSVGGELTEWTTLARNDANLHGVLWQLYHLFKEAPTLGSLINPLEAGRQGLKPLAEPEAVAAKLAEALERFGDQNDPAMSVFGNAANGLVRASDFLARNYHLVITNVPYLSRSKQADTLKRHIEYLHNDAKGDLATAFIDRCLQFCAEGGTVAVVTPQNWLFLGSYKHLRERLLKMATWNVVAKLGENGFQSTQAAGAFVALFVLTTTKPSHENLFVGLEASAPRIPAEKADLLRHGPQHRIAQSVQLTNPDARIAFDEVTQEFLLERFAFSWQGIKTSDDARFTRYFWEMQSVQNGWHFYQRSTDMTRQFGGREQVLYWEDGNGELTSVCQKGASFRGKSAWEKRGIAVVMMRELPCSLYDGNLFSADISIIEPRSQSHLSAIWAFCTSKEFGIAVRRIDQALKATNTSLVKVPFDLEHWQRVAAEQYPNGMPEPHSDDPTQWLFQGHAMRSTSPLQVAVARLLGYRWPQNEADDLDECAVADSIVSIPPVAGEKTAVQRLRGLLAAAYGPDWSTATEQRLLTEVGYSGQGLDDWLRDGFFAQHCRLFQNRPFLWHIWDGRKDGFSAVINYHKLDRSKLDRLIYTYLGDWINTQRHADSSGVAGANARLVSALALQEKLKAIADGEKPYDIYVRWKPIHKQPIGWEPDINDGVRLNIRPFVMAGILRSKFSVNWNKDRGTNPDGTERINDIHLSRDEKHVARELILTQPENT